MVQGDAPERFAKSLLEGIRRFIESSDFTYSDFPRWVRAANIRVADVEDSTILFFERTPDEDDEIIERQKVKTDVEFVFPNRHSRGLSYALNISNWEGDSPGISSVSDMTLSITEKDQSFTNIHRSEKHLSLAFIRTFLQYEPGESVESLRYLPLAIFVSSQYTTDFTRFWDDCAGYLLEVLNPNSNPFSPSYRSEPMREKGILTSVDNTVIILGSYKEPFKDEIRQVRDYLIRLGYDAFLIKDLPSKGEMSLSEKVRLWTTAARFCIMVDREASGHIKEYEIVKQVRTPLILLRPEDGGSTWMIGDDEIVDLNYINTFEFGNSPLGKTEEGVKWAEDLLSERGMEYPDFYPWRDSGL